MYTGYSYISEFLNVLTHIVGTNLSIVLLLYGVASIIGNWLGAKLLDRDSRKIILASPIVVSIILFGIFTVSSQTIPTVIFINFWGLFAGIINDISQYLMVSAAPQAPEFANGIFLSMGNVGVTIGTTIAGFVVAGIGVRYVMLFAILVLVFDLILLFTRTQKYNID